MQAHTFPRNISIKSPRKGASPSHQKNRRVEIMSLIQPLKLKWPLFVIGIVALFSTFAISQFAQTTSQSRTGYVNDFAAVLDEPTRNELTTLLENLKQKTGIELAVVTVDSTGGQSIDDYSLKLAREWNFGALSSSRKSLLMVVSVSDRSSFIRYSRSAPGSSAWIWRSTVVPPTPLSKMPIVPAPGDRARI